MITGYINFLVLPPLFATKAGEGLSELTDDCCVEGSWGKTIKSKMCLNIIWINIQRLNHRNHLV